MGARAIQFIFILTKMITKGSPMVGQFFDTMIVASSDKRVLTTHQNLSAGNCFEPP